MSKLRLLAKNALAFVLVSCAFYLYIGFIYYLDSIVNPYF